jgi:hypothetical protein
VRRSSRTFIPIGASNVQAVREQHPVDYLKVVASIVSRGENGAGSDQTNVQIVNVITGVRG